MKTKVTLQKIAKGLFLIAMSMNLANCGKSSDSSTTTTTTGYYVTNSVCYYNGVAQSSLSTCSSATSTYYGYMNSVCYQVGNGVFQQVSTSYCASTTTSSTSQTCSGYYTDGYRWAYCQEGTTSQYYNGSVIVMDCSGYTLRNQSGSTVTCL